MATHEPDPGLDFLKNKIVASMKEQGKDADVNSPEVHTRAIEIRAHFEKEETKAREWLKAKGFLKSDSN